MGGRTDGRTDGQTDRWTDGWVYEQMREFYLDRKKSQEVSDVSKRWSLNPESEPSLGGWPVEVFRWRLRVGDRDVVTLIFQESQTIT